MPVLDRQSAIQHRIPAREAGSDISVGAASGSAVHPLRKPTGESGAGAHEQKADPQPLSLKSYRGSARESSTTETHPACGYREIVDQSAVRDGRTIAKGGI